MEHPSNHLISRRDAIKKMAGTAGALTLGGRLFAQPAEPRPAGIQVDPSPLHELSPYLFMQFMEPLGTTDGSVAAAWDFGRDRWRQVFV